jgi:hypothetical protein
MSTNPMLRLQVSGLVTQAIKIPIQVRAANKPRIIMGNDFFIGENYKKGRAKKQ